MGAGRNSSHSPLFCRIRKAASVSWREGPPSANSIFTPTPPTLKQYGLTARLTNRASRSSRGRVRSKAIPLTSASASALTAPMSTFFICSSSCAVSLTVKPPFAFWVGGETRKDSTPKSAALWPVPTLGQIVSNLIGAVQKMRLGLFQPPAVEHFIELGHHAPDVPGRKAAVFHRIDDIAPAHVVAPRLGQQSGQSGVVFHKSASYVKMGSVGPVCLARQKTAVSGPAFPCFVRRPQAASGQLVPRGSWPWGWQSPHARRWCWSLVLPWEKSQRTRRPAPRVHPGPPAIQLWRRKNFLSLTETFLDGFRTGSAGIFQKLFHVLQPALHGPPHRAFVNALGQRHLGKALSEDDAGIHPAALGRGQAVQRVPQTAEPLLALQHLVRSGLVQAGGILDAVLTVQRILRLVAGEPPLVGRLIADAGPERLGHIVRNFHIFVLGIPVVKVAQVDDSHCMYLHIVFVVGLRETIWRAAGSGTRGSRPAPWDSLSQSWANKKRLRGKIPRKRIK